MSLLLVALLAAARVESVAVRPVDGRPGIVVVAHEALAPVVVSRDGSRLLVRIPQARLSQAFAGPRHFVWRAQARGGRSAHGPRGPARGAGARRRAAAPHPGPRRSLRRPSGRPRPSPRLRRGRAGSGAWPVAARGGRPGGRRPRPRLPATAEVLPTGSPSPVTGPPSAHRADSAVVARLRRPARPRRAPRGHGGGGRAQGPRAGPGRRRPGRRARAAGGRRGHRHLRRGRRGRAGLARRRSPHRRGPRGEGRDPGGHPRQGRPRGALRGRRASRASSPSPSARRPPSTRSRPPPPPPVAGAVDVRTLVSPEIYQGLFPATFGLEGEREAAAASDFAREGLQIGPVHLRPSILASYVDGEYTAARHPRPRRGPLPPARAPRRRPTCPSSGASSPPTTACACASSPSSTRSTPRATS